MALVATDSMAFQTTVASTAELGQASGWASADIQSPARPTRYSAAFSELKDSLGMAAYATVKRTLDVAVAATLLLAMLPLFAVIGLAILREGGGAIFYRADRIGRNGKRFRVVKFRSMRRGCDQNPHVDFVRSLLRGETSCSVYKVPNDSRVTRTGAFLRRTSLDELPQLWNVLRGDMSLVGPRPDVPYAVAEYADWLQPRLRVRPGITGLWQVSGRSRLSLLDMYRLDLVYASGACFLLDLQILLRTVPAVLGRDGAA
jgi:lipopolysaccharide/colanic/teichoic acid biosynthesis glycosyltransferase